MDVAKDPQLQRAAFHNLAAKDSYARCLVIGALNFMFLGSKLQNTQCLENGQGKGTNIRSKVDFVFRSQALSSTLSGITSVDGEIYLTRATSVASIE